MVYEESKRWINFLPPVLWAYCTSKCTYAQATTFSLAYEAKAVVAYDTMVPSVRLPLASKLLNHHDHTYDVETLEERRHSLKNK